MPQLPSGDALGAQVVQPAASDRIASAPNAGAVGEAMQRTGAAVGSLGGTIADVQDEFAVSRAFSNIYQAKAALDEKYRLNLGDPNTAVQRYTAELQAASAAGSAGIMQPRNKLSYNDMVSRFVIGRGADMIGARADAAIQNTAVAGLLQSGEDSITAFANAQTPEDRNGIAVAHSGQIDAMVKSGVIPAETGFKMKQDWSKRAASTYILSGGSQQEIARRAAEFYGQELPTQAANTNQPANAPVPAITDVKQALLVHETSGQELAPPKYSGGPAGVYQIDQPTAKSWGINYADLTDPSPAAKARVEAGLERGIAINTRLLTDGLGRVPTAAELTLAHQQGPQGAIDLLKNPDKMAGDVIPMQHVLDNGGTEDMTAAGFVRHVEEFYGAPSGQTTAAQPQRPLPVNYEDYINNLQPAPGSMASHMPADDLLNLQYSAATRAHAITTQGETDLKAQQAQADAALDQKGILFRQQLFAHAQDPNVPAPSLLDFMNSPEVQRDPQKAGPLIDTLLGVQDTLNKQPASSATALKNFQRDLLPVKTGQLTQAQIDQNMARGDYNLEYYQTLSGIAAGYKDPAQARVEKNSAAFIKDHIGDILHPMDMHTGDVETQDQRESAYTFTQDLDAKIAEFKKEGKDPNTLFDYNSKDYFGSASNMKKYVKSYADWQAQAQAELDAANPPKEGLVGQAADWIGSLFSPSLPAGIPAGSRYYGQTKWGAPVYVLPDGTKQAVGARPNPNAPTVPTGE